MKKTTFILASFLVAIVLFLIASCEKDQISPLGNLVLAQLDDSIVAISLPDDTLAIAGQKIFYTVTVHDDGYYKGPIILPGCTITPSSMTVESGSTAVFNFTLNDHHYLYSVIAVGGCNKTESKISTSGLSGTYTTSPITGNCDIWFFSATDTYTITSVAGPGGVFTTPSPVSGIPYGATGLLKIKPNTGYKIDEVKCTGCSGYFSGNSDEDGYHYNVSEFNSDTCIVYATFSLK